MTTRANITSVDAVKSFRSSLIVYTSKARPTLEEVTSDVIRMRVWLETEQRVFWEAEGRRRLRRLEEAKQKYFTARLSLMRGEASAAEKMAVTRAQNAVDEADGKLRIIKKWNKEFDARTEPLARQLEKNAHAALSRHAASSRLPHKGVGNARCLRWHGRASSPVPWPGNSRRAIRSCRRRRFYSRAC